MINLKVRTVKFLFAHSSDVLSYASLPESFCDKNSNFLIINQQKKDSFALEIAELCCDWLKY